METTGQKPINISMFKETEEDWYPSFKIERDVRYKGLVKVSFIELIPSHEWRVCVWGQDDDGCEIDFPPRERLDAWEIFISLISEKYITHNFLKKCGMVYGA